MSSTPETQKVILRERDRALICYEKHGKGRCRKMVATPRGEVVCDNGHTIPVFELFNEFLKQPDWTVREVGGVWPAPDAIAAVIKRVATPEFLRAKWDEWQSTMICHLPFLSWLIHYAEMLDRKAAFMLKDFLEQEIRRQFPILGRYLDAVKIAAPGSPWVKIRERIFRSVGNFRSWRQTPEEFLGCWEIHREAAKYLSDANAWIYQYNVEEASECVESEGGYCPLYFTPEGRTGDEIQFNLLPDPCWQWGGWWHSPQIHLRYRSEIGDIKWNLGNSDRGNEIGGKIRRTLKQRLRFREESNWAKQKSWGFHANDSDHINIMIPENRRGSIILTHMEPTLVLEIMQALRSELGGNHFGDYLKP